MIGHQLQITVTFFTCCYHSYIWLGHRSGYLLQDWYSKKGLKIKLNPKSQDKFTDVYIKHELSFCIHISLIPSVKTTPQLYFPFLF